MSIITVDVMDRRPLYEQLVDNVTKLVLNGVLKPGEQLPPVRTLASELAINPNTIQKAYGELEKRHIINSIPGRGSFIAGDTDNIKTAEALHLMSKIHETLSRLYAFGIQYDEILNLVNKVWKGENS